MLKEHVLCSSVSTKLVGFIVFHRLLFHRFILLCIQARRRWLQNQESVFSKQIPDESLKWAPTETKHGSFRVASTSHALRVSFNFQTKSNCWTRSHCRSCLHCKLKWAHFPEPSLFAFEFANKHNNITNSPSWQGIPHMNLLLFASHKRTDWTFSTLRRSLSSRCVTWQHEHQLFKTMFICLKVESNYSLKLYGTSYPLEAGCPWWHSTDKPCKSLKRFAIRLAACQEKPRYENYTNGWTLQNPTKRQSSLVQYTFRTGTFETLWWRWDERWQRRWHSFNADGTLYACCEMSAK